MAYTRPEPLGRHHRLDAFASGEPALDHWLVAHARGAHSARSARVFVSVLSGSREVIGYYALAAAQVAPGSATARLLKGEPLLRSVPAVLLARLAVDGRHQGAGLGKALLRDAAGRVFTAAESVGIRALVVHAKHEAARDWYLQYGFEPSASDPFHLMLLLKDLRALVDRPPTAPTL